MFINLVHLVIVLRSNNPHPFLFFFIFGSFRIHFELNEIKGDRIKESLNVSDLIIFISTFIYRKSIRCWWYTRIHAFTVFPSFPKTIQQIRVRVPKSQHSAQHTHTHSISEVGQRAVWSANGITYVFDLMLIQSGILN